MASARALILLVVIFLPVLDWAAVMPSQPRTPWSSLTVEQQHILAPAQPDWNRLTPQQQTRLVHAARHFSKLSPEEKKRFQQRIRIWTHLPQATRDQARKNFRQYHALSPDKRAVIRSRWRARQGAATTAAVSGATGAQASPTQSSTASTLSR